MARILIIDDDAAFRESLAETITDLGHEVRSAANGREGLAALAEGGVAAVLLDLRMPEREGLAVLEDIMARPAAPPVAVITAAPSGVSTIEAMRLGAFDYLTKPVGREALAALLARMLTPPLPSSLAAPPPEGGLIGSSAAMREVQKQIGRLADRDVTVLITGETGTGKEVVARAIHNFGRRRERPFVAVNCAAIPADLLESELFGHVRGAFTGAHTDRLGAFRAAEGGTLFLDEIGDMSLALQAKLLRVLETREVTPLGGRPVGVDVRILCATHRDLPAEVAAGRFREDLYFRIGVVPLHLPPLRERLADILPLAEHFLAPFGKRLDPSAARLLLSHSWPGNVRELRNAMERVAALDPAPVITAASLSFLEPAREGKEPLSLEALLSLDLPQAVAALEREMIERALAASGGNRAEAARRLGIHRPLLYEKMRRLGIGEKGGGVRKPDG